MKKIISGILMFTILMTCSISGLAAKNTTAEINTIDLREVNDNSTEIAISERMNREEIIQSYMKTNGVSLEEAQKIFPISYDRAKVSYRTLSVYLPVTTSYKPHIEFYCQTSENGNYWGIVSVYKATLVRSYNGTSKQFTGELQMWLRSAYQIEYMINGDFYNNGTTTVSGGSGVEIGVGESAKFSYSASVSTSSNWFKYYYKHETKAFQQ